MNEHNSQHAAGSVEHARLSQQAFELVGQLQHELDALREQLAWSNRLSQLGILAAALGHEINNLLVPVGSYAQLAKANPGDDRLNQRALNAAIAGSAKIGKLVEGVVSLASPNADQGLQSCQVNEVVEDAIVCMLPIIKQHSVNVISRVEPVRAGIDALSLEQVLVNLISNASQAMSTITGKRQIEIESMQDESALTLRVTDTGPGIPEALHDRLFEPFVTLRTNAAEQSTGNGLGLSICKQLIESAGGSITLANKPKQQGASFVIRLLNSPEPI